MISEHERPRRSACIALACAAIASVAAGCGGSGTTVPTSTATPGASGSQLAPGQALLRVVNGSGAIEGTPCMNVANNAPVTISISIDGAIFGTEISTGAATNYIPVFAQSHTMSIECQTVVPNVVPLFTNIVIPPLTAGGRYTIVLAGTELSSNSTTLPPGAIESLGTLEFAFFVDPPTNGPSIRFYHVAPSAPATVAFGWYANGVPTQLSSATFVASNPAPAYVVPSLGSGGVTPVPLPNQPAVTLTPTPTGETVIAAPPAAAQPPGLTIYAGRGTVPFATPAPSTSPAVSPTPSPPAGVTGPSPLPLPSSSPVPVSPPAGAVDVFELDQQDTTNVFPFGTQNVLSVFLIDPVLSATSMPTLPQLFGILQ